MKAMKKLMALLLCAACLCSLLTAPASAAFSDVTDPDMARAVEVLHAVGAIDGVPGGLYNPSGILTRAEFCKLLVMVMNRGDDVPVYASRTIFPDVTSTHWARGYINLAASEKLDAGDGTEGTRLIMGVGDGTFAPDRIITYGEAVTLLLRVIGYSAAANTNWPSGALSTANSIGLADGLGSPDANGGITRGQAALLFYNMLTTNPNGSDSSYYDAVFGRMEEGVLLLSADTTGPDGRKGAVHLVSADNTQSWVRPADEQPDAADQGRRGTVLYNKEGQLLAFLPDTRTTSRTITAASATMGNPSIITASDGTTVRVSEDVAIWALNDKNVYEQKKYSEIYLNLNRTGATLTVYYTAAGAVDYMLMGTAAASSNSNAMAAKDPITGNPFATLTGGAVGYTIVKNGSEASVSDIRRYDVGVFDAAANTLYVTDFRLTGVYEAATPNTTSPTEITVLGQKFSVLESAASDLKDFKLGSTITLLFTTDGKVAGVVSSSAARANAVGVVSEESTSEKVVIDLLGAPESIPTVSGRFIGNVDSYKGNLVSVSAGAATGGGSVLYLSRLTSSSANAAFNVRTRTVGELALAENVMIYERVGNSPVAAISMSDLTVDSVPAAKVVYTRQNYAGKIDLMVLDDVTGDRYTYGIVSTEERKTLSPVGSTSENAPDVTIINTVTTVSGKNGSVSVVGNFGYIRGSFAGLVASSENHSVVTDVPKSAAQVALRAVENVSLANFNLQTNRFFSGSLELPIAKDVQCYNAQTKTWFGNADTTPEEDLAACLAYSNNLTVYYDRDPNQGGKVRIIVAN